MRIYQLKIVYILFIFVIRLLLKFNYKIKQLKKKICKWKFEKNHNKQLKIKITAPASQTPSR